LKGENSLEAIYFNKEGDYSSDKAADTEYFVTPDMVICENGMAQPRLSLAHLVPK